jgi:hypothetical protein
LGEDSKMNKSILAILGAGGLALIKNQQDGSLARSPFESEKMKKRFKELNGYSIDYLAEIILDQWIKMFIIGTPILIGHYGEQIFKEDARLSQCLFTALDAEGCVADLIEKGADLSINPSNNCFNLRMIILTGKKINVEPFLHIKALHSKEYDLSNKAFLIKNIKDLDFNKPENYFLLRKSMFEYAILTKSQTNVSVKTGYNRDTKDFLLNLGFNLSKNSSLQLIAFLKSNSVALESFKEIFLSTVKHELFHLLEDPTSNKKAPSKEGGLINYMSSRAERHTWGISFLELVKYQLKTRRVLKEKFGNPILYDSYYSRFVNGDLSIYLEELLYTKSLIKDKEYYRSTLNKIKELKQNGAPQKEVNDFIIKLHPILKDAPFQYWKKVIETYLKDLNKNQYK